MIEFDSEISSELFLNGKILTFNKPIGWSSFDLVKKIRNLLKIKYKFKKLKVGHAGTLDPLASGLMIICTGKFTKKISQIQDQDKTYVADVLFGATTPSFDLETEIDKTYDTKSITLKKIQDNLQEFNGEIEQIPPIYSALKVDGERLYKKARRGEKIIIKSRKVIINSIEIIEAELPRIRLKINCSKGTYIRSIAHDLGKKLNNGAHLISLIRTNIGEFNLKSSLSIEDFEKKLNS
ncbi:MAG: tRNA pseudouridine(55) synthase TruB [Flavobacteriales bacterium]|jgi:tRNA pseudouridine55 synthase|nr:tRNA pseudouridine(55) synthase TruB [Flavobacteriales bacterium]|tara:strand:+ start:22773 stop:23483 length:711 start_codon:yes stop_codon:yes gene_type:complete